jgi:cytidine deaminase|tara:strand:+ start:2712 stop:3170 length:459 start_codon:yes stop_codon:yes gene_type:complete
MDTPVWLDAEGLEKWQPLFDAALAARAKAYAPYSSFMVGAAIMTGDGAIFTGANYESASYGLTLCAERAALCAAQSAEAVPAITAIAICAKPEGSNFAPEADVVRPCGACRQWIFEASKRAGRDIQVLCGDADFSKVIVTSAEQLLPDGFSL